MRQVTVLAAAVGSDITMNTHYFSPFPSILDSPLGNTSGCLGCLFSVVTQSFVSENWVSLVTMLLLGGSTCKFPFIVFLDLEVPGGAPVNSWSTIPTPLCPHYVAVTLSSHGIIHVNFSCWYSNSFL